MTARSLLALAALLCLVAGSAQAAPLGAQAESITMQGHLDVAGDLLALLLFGDARTLQGMEVTADDAQMLRWVNHGAYGPCAVPPCLQQSVLVDEDPQRIPEQPARDVDLRLRQPVDPGHRLVIFPHGDGAITFTGQRVASTSAPQLCLMGDGFTPGKTGCAGYKEEQVGFSNIMLDGPLQRVNASGEHVVLRGDLILEMEGVQIMGGGLDFDTRQTSSGTVAGMYERPFGRVLLHNATIRIELGDDVRLEWILRDATTLARGAHVTLTEASGRIQLADGARALATQDVFEGNFLLRSTAVEDTIAFEVEPRNAQGLPLAAALPAQAFWPSAAAVLAAAIPMLGVALIVRRHGAHTSMEDVERALNDGRYTRASRLSGRILRHDPLHESAHLSRAIALTRAGQARRAVAHMRAHLSRHTPSDGTLHYAMGVALMELQQADEAKEAWAHAVRLTPSLRSEVALDLHPAQDDAYT